MDNNFLVDNPNKPRKPRISPEQRARLNKGLKTVAALGSALCLIFGPGVATFFAMKLIFHGTGLGTVLLGGIIGGSILSIRLKGKELSFTFGFITNAAAVGGCIVLPGFFFPHVAENVTMLANTSNVTPVLNNSAANATALANAMTNVTAALNNVAANATALANTSNVTPALNNSAANVTALSNVTQSITCTFVPLPDMNNSYYACFGNLPQVLAAHNVTFPAKAFMASLNATPVLGAVAGPVREVRSLVSRKLESLNRSLKL